MKLHHQGLSRGSFFNFRRVVPSFSHSTSKQRLQNNLINHLNIIPGLIGLIAVCGIGAYKYRYRGEMSTSVFLMQLRVAAQGTCVGALSLGLAYTMANKWIFKPNDGDEK